jgi:predicted component of type VI protein secretion system
MTTSLEITGIKFPFRFVASGGVEVCSGDEKIKSNLYALVLSKKNERLVRKAVGTIGYDMILRSASESAASIETFLYEAILEFEPRVTQVTVRVSSMEGVDGVSVFAEIGFKVKGSTRKMQVDVPLS